MSEIRDLAYEAPDDARRIILELYELNDCAFVAVARFLGTTVNRLRELVDLLGLQPMLRAAALKRKHRFADPEEVLRSTSRRHSGDGGT